MIKKHVIVTLMGGLGQVKGISMKVNKKENMIIVKDTDNLSIPKINPNIGGKKLTEPAGSRKETIYIPLDHVLYWQKFIDNEEVKNEKD